MTASEVVVKFKGDKTDLSKTIDGISDETAGMADRMERTGRGLTMGLTLPIIGAGVAAVSAANEQEVADAKLAATIESMGAASWTSVEALKANAAALQENSTFGDEAIQGFQDLLLTFGNITNQVGEGNDIFDQTTQLGLDMSAALGQDLKSSAIQLGKALNDPIAGITALSRVGVSFTEEQKDMIKTMVESGDTMGAQKLILETLEDQFGGTAQAVADTTQGQMQQAMNDLGDAAESIGAILAPVIGQMADFLADLSRRFQNLSPGARRVIVLLGGLAAAAGPVLIVGGKMVRGFADIKKAFSALNLVMKANPYVTIIAATIALVTLIVANWDEIKEFLLEVWEKIKEFADTIWTGIKDGLQAIWEGISNVATTIWEGIKSFFSTTLESIKTTVSTVWEGIKTIIEGALDLIKSWFMNWTAPGLIISHWDNIKDAATKVWEWVRDKFNTLVGFFTALPGRIRDALLSIWDTIVSPFQAAWQGLVDFYNSTVAKIPGFGSIGGGDRTTRPPDVPPADFDERRGGFVPSALSPQAESQQLVQLVVDGRVLAEAINNYETGLA